MRERTKRYGGNTSNGRGDKNSLANPPNPVRSVTNWVKCDLSAFLEKGIPHGSDFSPERELSTGPRMIGGLASRGATLVASFERARPCSIGTLVVKLILPLQNAYSPKLVERFSASQGNTSIAPLVMVGIDHGKCCIG